MNPHYDTAVRISNSKLFFAALTEFLGAIKNIRWYGLGNCVYIAYRYEHFSKPKTSPILVKEPRHSYQREVRLVWESLDPDIVPIVITSPKARSFCSLVSDEELQESTNTTHGR